MKKQKVSEKEIKEIPVINLSDDDNVSKDNEDYELSPEEIYEKKQKTKEISDQIKELEKQKEDLNKELNYKNTLDELYESFKKPKDEFVFKVEFNDKNFKETIAKNYILAIIKSKCEDIKVIKYKRFIYYLWFKLNKEITIRWFIKKVQDKDNLPGFKITQLRCDRFFEDI